MTHKKKTKEEKKKVELTQKEYEDLIAKADERDEFYDKWLKVHAEYENTRKRMEKEQLTGIRFANENIISRLFPIVDNFDMALDAMDKAEDKAAVMDGIKLVQKEFHRVMDENGVEKIKTVGEEFDPNVHEAVQAIETDEEPDGTILEEVRAGYLLNGRLLRAAQVIVAKNSD